MCQRTLLLLRMGFLHDWAEVCNVRSQSLSLSECKHYIRGKVLITATQRRLKFVKVNVSSPESASPAISPFKCEGRFSPSLLYLCFPEAF